MKSSLFFTLIPLLCAAPVLAQSMDQSMPGMSMPAPKPAAKAKAPVKVSKPTNSKPVAKSPALAPTSPPSSGKEVEPGVSEPAEPMSGMDMSGMASPTEPAEEEVGQEPAPAPPKDYAADKVFDPVLMASARRQLRKEHGGSRTSKVMLNLAEYQVRDGENGYRWEGEAWFGGDINRLVLKSEGEGGVKAGVEASEIQALYSRAITPYFDLQAGIRYDFNPNPARTYATIGVEGLAPYWFETQSALFLSDHGELLGRLEGTYDLRLTQRWILQPRAEINLAAQDIPEIGVGSGISNVELGLRLRYEFRRELAPYIGLTYDAKLGDTADFARSHGEEPEQTGLVFGVRAWY